MTDAYGETVARRRSAALLSEFGLGHVREYAPFDLILSALHLILRATFSWSEHPSGASRTNQPWCMITLILKCVTPEMTDDSVGVEATKIDDERVSWTKQKALK